MNTRSLLLMIALPLAGPPSLAGPLGSAASSQDPSPGIVARVGAIEITEEDLAKEVNRLIPSSFYHARVSQDVLEKMEGQALDNLVERALIYLDAMDRGFTATEAEIHAEFARTLEKAGPEYANIPDEQRRELREFYRAKIVRRILLDKNEARFEAGVPGVTESRLMEVYESRKGELLTPPEVRFLHILIKVPPSASSADAQELRATAEEVQEEISRGTDFSELAKKYSNDIYAARGGDMGFVHEGSFKASAVDGAAFALRDGEISGLIDSMYGFHFVKRVETRPRRRLTFEEAKEALRSRLNDELRTARRSAWLAELRKLHGVHLPPRSKEAEVGPPPTDG